MAEDTISQSSIRDEGDQQISYNTPIPSSLKFLMNSIKTIALHPLTTENHHLWSAQVFRTFGANGFSGFLDNTKPQPPKFIQNTSGEMTPNPNYATWMLIDQNLSAALYTTISPTILPYVLNLETAADIWSTLQKRLQATNRSRVMQLKNELHHIDMKDQTMSQYLSEIKKIVDLLAAAGTTIDSEDIILYTLNGLPPTYQAFKMAVRTKIEPIALDDFYSLLCSEETNLATETAKANQASAGAMAMMASRNRESHSSYRGKGRFNSRGGKPNTQTRTNKQHINCQICGKPGHSAKICWYRGNTENQTSQTAFSADQTQSQPI